MVPSYCHTPPTGMLAWSSREQNKIDFELVAPLWFKSVDAVAFIDDHQHWCSHAVERSTANSDERSLAEIYMCANDSQQYRLTQPEVQNRSFVKHNALCIIVSRSHCTGSPVTSFTKLSLVTQLRILKYNTAPAEQTIEAQFLWTLMSNWTFERFEIENG